jgi:hypothetical protein
VIASDHSLTVFTCCGCRGPHQNPSGLFLDWLEEPRTAVGAAALLLGALWTALCMLRVWWLAVTVLRVPLLLAPPPCSLVHFTVPFAGALLLEGFSTCCPIYWYLPWLEGCCCCNVLQFSFGQFVECLLQPCLWSSPWQNCLTNFMAEIKTLEF